MKLKHFSNVKMKHFPQRFVCSLGASSATWVLLRKLREIKVQVGYSLRLNETQTLVQSRDETFPLSFACSLGATSATRVLLHLLSPSPGFRPKTKTSPKFFRRQFHGASFPHRRIHVHNNRLAGSIMRDVTSILNHRRRPPPPAAAGSKKEA